MPGGTKQEAVIRRLVEAVADAKNTTPLELTPALNDVVEADALATLVASGDANLWVAMKYAGVRVTINGAGEIMAVSRLAEADDGTENTSAGIASE